ncbi:uncharacterized protein E0L32_005445 [Thyridium curvatum]|uniref:FAD dependent oxidoreductase domain-containing protein n=1 Tax=Thyridium curvatum TaxID=1093900 RepID=A0A507BBS0_9PEZI|nr:uncharacterized protein E0L32_005445 [Thyridium curvatum]TPX14481.1 hypothetical protein E0L32_005445 [Thyridium curvatum]
MATTVILGSGIIGVSAAYYLSDHQPASSIHLVEPSPELFASASGFAGGFLARDWFGPADSSLGALSFDLHRKLAEKCDGRAQWGYAATTTFNYTGPSAGPKSGKKATDWLFEGTSRAEAAPDAPADDNLGPTPPWLRRQAGDRMELIGGEGTTAQI